MISSENARPLIIPWTPTLSAASGSVASFTVQTARAHMIGRFVYFNAMITVTNNGTAGGFILVSTPTEIRQLNQVQYCIGRNLSNAQSLQCLAVDAGFIVVTYNNAHPVVSGQAFNISGWYERF